MSQAALGDLLECSVCLEPLGTEHKVLPCQHTFCTRCLVDVKTRRQRDKQEQQRQQQQQQQQQQADSDEADLLCPECRAPCLVPLDKLPSNVILNRILEGIKSEKKSGGTDVTPKAPPATTQPSIPKRDSISATASSSPFAAPVSAAPPTNIPGNLSTNPFLNMIATSSTPTPTVPTPPSPAPMLPPKPNSSSSSTSVAFFPSPTPPSRPPAQHGKKPVSSVSTNSNNPTASPASLPTSASAGHQIYRALYDYKPCKEDELELTRGQLYVVADKCRDGWYKGTTVEGLKSGVFPGNYVQHIAKPTLLQPSKADPTLTTSPSGQSLSSKASSDDLIDLSELSELTELFCSTATKKKNPPAESPTKPSNPPPRPPPTVPVTATGWATFPKDDDDPPPPPLPPAAMETAGRRLSAVAAARRAVPSASPLPQAATTVERYRCIMSYPASGEFELELKVGDVVFLHKKREDGWCKGTLERTGQTGLFPITFVTKMR